MANGPDGNSLNRGWFSILFHSHRWINRVTLMIALSLPIGSLHAQTDFTRVLGPVDQDVKVPSTTGVFGHVDAAASTEILQHIQAVGAASWQDMTATGKITYPSGDKEEVAKAALSILSGDNYRLDITTARGTRSIRITGGGGGRLEPDGSKELLLPVTAAQGFLAFPQLRVPTFPTNQTSLYDEGMVSVAGTTLHRLAEERPLGRPRSAALLADKATSLPSVVTDLYFDPASHLLIKSVASIRLSGQGSDYVRCTTYADYRKVGASLIPFLLTESLNGQVQWTLQLDSVALNTGLAPTTFEF